MFGTRQEEAQDRTLFAKARATYENTEVQRVPVRMNAVFRYGQPSLLTVTDPQGNWAQAQGELPQQAVNRPLMPQDLVSRLGKTGGTPYYVEDTMLELDPGITLPASAINALRRDALSRLSAVRGQVPARQEGTFSAPPVYGAQRQKPVYTVSVQTVQQLTAALLQFAPAVLYMPLWMLCSGDPAVQAACEKLHVCAVLPRVILESEWDGIYRQLSQAKLLGVQEALVGNIGMLDPVRRAGFQIRGDFGLNVFNSATTNYLYTQGLSSLTASFELTLPQIRDLSKPLPMELIAYGRLPLMVTENCIIRERTGGCTCRSAQCNLVDRTGSRFPVVRDGSTCRSVILNSRKLYWGDKLQELSALGLWPCG